MTTYSQPGIINALDYGMVANSLPSDYTTAQNNAIALQNAIYAAQNSSPTLCPTAPPSFGAAVLIPSNSVVPITGNEGNGALYYIACPPGQTEPGGQLYAVEVTCYWPLLISGTSTATKLVMVGNQNGDFGDMFYIANNTGPALSNIGGISFQDLEIAYYTGASAGDAAIRLATGAENIRLFRMLFLDCPVGIALDHSLQVSIIDSVVWYSEYQGGTAVSIGTAGNAALETYIAGCVFESGVSTGGTGLSIVNADEVRLANTRIEAFDQGIVIAPTEGSAQHLHFENASAFTYSSTNSTTGGAALLIQPTGTGKVLSAVFIGCVFGPSAVATTEYVGPGVMVDQSQTSKVVDQVRFVSCYSSTWPGSGMQINGSVTNVEILGGHYACNGTAAQAGVQYSGIAITSAASGVASGVRIVGAACNNSVYSTVTGGYLPASQDYGVSIASGAANVFVQYRCWARSNEPRPDRSSHRLRWLQRSGDDTDHDHARERPYLLFLLI
jgi:hypothetical protein